MSTTLPWWIRQARIKGRFMTQPQQEQQQPLPENPVQKQQQEYKHPENEIALEPINPKDVQQKQEQTQREQKQEQKK
jgi:hypothetical protein